WEMAARGGVNGGWDYTYSGSDSISTVAWYDGNSYDRNDGNYKTHEVGKKQANALGVYDMSGNVLEWCDNYYSSSSSSRANRGGSFSSYDANYCGVSDRNYVDPSSRGSRMGFRVVCTAF
ncbi:MAG: SUMF1/EgtB/PvdO family nonheme iron enzyme, partial [Treponema sp.]|nr:SUMF1/EgtB/PvdO family nonheme iron enzyme [Treponema sp.]